MKLHIEARTLTQALNTVKPATTSKTHDNSNLISLSFDSSADTLSIAGYDFTNYMRVIVDVDAENVRDNLVIALPLDTLLGTVSKLSGDITLNIVSSTLLVISEGENNFKVNCVNPEVLLEAPKELKEVSNADTELVINSSKLLKLASLRSSKEMSKGCLTCVALSPSQIAATDSHRLITIAHEDYDDVANIILIPRTFLESIDFKALGNNWTLRQNDKYISAESEDGNVLFSSIQGSGTYPQLSSIMPKQFLITLSGMSCSLIASSLEKISVYAQNNLVKMTVDADNLIFYTSGQKGEASVKVPHTSSSITQDLIDNWSISINLAFLQDAISKGLSSTATLQFNQWNNPCLITSEASGGAITELIMPVQAN